jgi:urease accessory protein
MSRLTKTPMRQSVSRRWLLLLFVTFGLSPDSASAHVGFGGTSGLVDGLAHPFTGLDHFCVMLAVGLWASQCRGRMRWLASVTFVIFMGVGGLLGGAGVVIPLVEPGIAASVLVLGMIVAAAIRLPLVASVLVVGLFALFHGHSHGAEMPVTASGVLYGFGFLLATGMIQAGGFLLGRTIEQQSRGWLIQCAGGAMSAAGIYLCLV